MVSGAENIENDPSYDSTKSLPHRTLQTDTIKYDTRVKVEKRESKLESYHSRRLRKTYHKHRRIF